MAELLRSLQDSQLVARFQRRCGLFPAPDEDPRENGAGPGEGAARAPGGGHHPAVNGRGGGGPANGLLRAAAPQVTVGQVYAGVGRRGRGRGLRLRGRRTSGPGDSAAGTGGSRACGAERAPSPQRPSRLLAPSVAGRTKGESTCLVAARATQTSGAPRA